jgi:hypothetical protein
MEFDEVNRVNNIFPLFDKNAKSCYQDFYHLKLFGIKIPVMLKEYISFAVVYLYSPIVLFENPLVGIRVLSFVYFVVAMTLLYIFARKHNYYIAFFVALLMTTSPLMYPGVILNKLTVYQIIFALFSFHFFYAYFCKSHKLFDLFFATFLLLWTCNICFYFMWVVASLILATLLFFPAHWRKTFRSLKNILVIGAGFFLGLLHFILYNIARGFPTLKILFLKLIVPSEYNKRPVDFIKSPPFPAEMIMKLKSVIRMMGKYYGLHIGIFLIISMLFFLMFIILLKAKSIKKYQLYFFPFAVFLIMVPLIVMSPKTRRAHHYSFLLPFYYLSVASIFLLIADYFKLKGKFRYVLLSLPSLLLLLNFISSYRIIETYNHTHGTRYYSPAIFGLHEYIAENNIDSKKIIFLQWGMHAQLYFLRKGRFRINSRVTPLLKAESEAEKIDVISKYLMRYANWKVNTLYFPLYNNRVGNHLFVKNTNLAFFEFLRRYGGKLREIKVFHERTGEKVIHLYELRNIQELTEKLKPMYRKKD